MKGLSKFLKRKDGSTAAEFAIILPVFLLFLFGIIQFGLIMFVHNNMINAARESARRLSVDDTITEVEAVNVANTFLADWPLNYGITAEDDTTTGDDFVRVTITLPMADAAIVPDITNFLGTMMMSARVIMRKEG